VEFGFSGLFVVFAAHARSNPDKNKAELASFSSFVLIWSLSVVALFFPIVLVIGYVVISRQNPEIDWQAQWIFYALIVASTIFTNFISSWYEGSKSVIKAFTIRTVSSIASVVTTILILRFYGGMWALPSGILVANLISIFLLLPSLLAAAKACPTSTIETFKSWFKKLWPLLKKNAGSFIGGYISFQAPTVLTYLMKGAEEAGKIGFTMNSWMSAFTIFHTILSANSSLYSELWARGEKIRAWQTSKSKRNQAIVFFMGASLCAIIFISLLNSKLVFLSRLASALDMLILAIGLALHLAVASVGVFTRSGKIEVFNNLSLFTAVASTVVTVASIYFRMSPFLGFLFGNILALIWLPRLLKPLGINRSTV
jgi:hypothetical protein